MSLISSSQGSVRLKVHQMFIVSLTGSFETSSNQYHRVRTIKCRQQSSNLLTALVQILIYVLFPKRCCLVAWHKTGKSHSSEQAWETQHAFLALTSIIVCDKVACICLDVHFSERVSAIMNLMTIMSTDCIESTLNCLPSRVSVSLVGEIC